MKKKLFWLTLLPILLSGCQTTSTSSTHSESQTSLSSQSEISSSEEKPISSSSESLTPSSKEESSSSSKSSSETPSSSEESSSSSKSSSETPSSSSQKGPEEEFDVSKYYGGYYNNITSWTNSEDLINQLHNLMKSTYVGISYDDPNWETNQFADQALDNFMNVNPVYSYQDVLKTETNTKWQREHVFNASAMTGLTTTVAVDTHDGKPSRATDFLNLFASDSSGNSVRSNNGFAMCSDTSYVPTGTGDYKYDSTTQMFEPSDFDKGRIARGVLYMCVMYNEDEVSEIKQTGVKYGNGTSTKTVHINAKYKALTLTEDYVQPKVVSLQTFANNDAYAEARKQYLGSEATLESVVKGDVEKFEEVIGDYSNAFVDYRYDNYSFNMGKKSDILNWATNYGVDRLEYQHNQSVYEHVFSKTERVQGNRNPFVDYPELVDYCFGSKMNQAGEMKHLVPSAHTLEIDSDAKGFANFAISEHETEFLVGDTFDSSSYEIVRVNKDFSTEKASGYTDKTEPYTFKESDLGKKKVQVKIDNQVIDCFVNVKDAGMASCKKHRVMDKTDFTKGSDNGSFTFEEGNVWSYKFKNAITSAFSNYPSKGGVKIGTATNTADTATFTSNTSFNNVDAVYFSGNVSSGMSIGYKIYVGDSEVTSGSYTYDKSNTTPIEFGASFGPVSGKIKIEITGITAALYFNEIAYNL
mgnify:CR=1 FL=1